MWFLLVCAVIAFGSGLVNLLAGVWGVAQAASPLDKSAAEAALGARFIVFCSMTFGSALLAAFSLIVGWLAEVGPLVVLLAEKP